MNKIASPVTKPKASFSAGSFAALRSVTGESNGEPLRIALDLIDEDPDQPRKIIDDADLAPMVATIRSHGILQPVGLHPAADGRYRLAFGARRLRASRLAEQTDIPAVIVPEKQRSYTSQVIENQQRVNLSNSDLAAAVMQLHNDGVSVVEIGTICALKEYQVTAYRAVAKFPPFLTDRVNAADIRALYDLFRQWKKTPAEVEAGLPATGAFVSITEARRIVGAITGKASGSIVLEKHAGDDDEGQGRGDNGENLPKGSSPEILHGAGFDDTTMAAETPSEKARADTATPTSDRKKAAPQVVETAPAQPVEGAGASRAPVFIVAIGNGERGQLVIDRHAEQAGWALVRYETRVEEVELSSLRIVAIE